MSNQTQLVELEMRHKALEKEIIEARTHLSTDGLTLAELKRRKLMVKDQIERMRHDEHSLH